MNRRQFIKRGAMVAAAVAVAPAAVLTAKDVVIETCATGPIPLIYGAQRVNGFTAYWEFVEYAMLDPRMNVVLHNIQMPEPEEVIFEHA